MTGSGALEPSVAERPPTPRAFAFQLLAQLMLRAPDAAMLQVLRSLDAGTTAASAHGESPFARHWQAIAAAAAAADPATLEQEYTDLFIGLGRGQVIPYGSWYVTGFLMDRPLAALRADLARLGFERDEAVAEPEDHVGAICEVMAMLIDEQPSGPDAPAGMTGDGAHKQFFNAHLSPWAKAFFRDVAEAPAADFYQPVARFGEALIDFETDYQGMLG